MQRHRTPLRHALVLTPKLLLLVQPPLERLLLLPRAAPHAGHHLMQPDARVCKGRWRQGRISSHLNVNVRMGMHAACVAALALGSLQTTL